MARDSSNNLIRKIAIAGGKMNPWTFGNLTAVLFSAEEQIIRIELEFPEVHPCSRSILM